MLSVENLSQPPRSSGRLARASSSKLGTTWTRFAAHGGRIVWTLVRVPFLALLVVLEPLVTTICVGAALAGVLTTLVFRLSGVAPQFPFWQVLAGSVGCSLVAALYHRVLRLLSR
jgi:hypothetical protein